MYQNSDAKGCFEYLMERIEKDIDSAEGGWTMMDDGLSVQTRVSRDLNRSRNGGEYNEWTEYRTTGLTVQIVEVSSCELVSDDLIAEIDCIITVDGLKRMAEVATVTIAAKALVNKEAGAFRRLKDAIKALSE